MLVLNILNVERLIFQDDEIWKSMPELSGMRDQWRISKLSPSLRPTGRRAMHDFLKAAKNKYEGVISEKLGCEVTIDRIDNRAVTNLELNSLDDMQVEGFYSGFATYREGDRVFVTLWR